MRELTRGRSVIWRPCDQFQVVQRGASNAYYPVVETAIDIRVGEESEESVFDLIRLHPKWEPLLTVKAHIESPNDPVAAAFIGPILADEKLQKLGVTADLIWDCLQDAGKVADAALPTAGETELLAKRKAFDSPREPSGSSSPNKRT